VMHSRARDGGFGGLLVASLARLKELVVAGLPKLFRYDGFNRRVDVFTLRFDLPLFAEIAGEIAPIETLGGGVFEKALDAGVTPFIAVAGTEPLLIENPCHRFLALVLGEKFVHEPANGCHPPDGERVSCSQGLAELGPDGDRRAPGPPGFWRVVPRFFEMHGPKKVGQTRTAAIVASAATAQIASAIRP
jgi:hypothetical protein